MTLLDKTIKAGKLELKNRLVMAPVALGKSDAGKVSEGLLNYYDERTKGGHIGLVVIEHSFIRADGRSSKNQLSAAADSDVEGLKRLSSLVHRNGSKVILQLNHAGGAVKKGITGEASISPSGIKNPLGMLGQGEVQASRSMTKPDIDAVIASFAEAAVRAEKAGFDGCELHSAHGYLLNQFYSPLTNKRTDAYSGSTLEGRIRLHRKVIAAVKEAVGSEFLLSMRFGGCDYTAGGSTIEDAAFAAVELEKAGLDLLDMSGGMCFFLREGHTEAGYFSDLSEVVKRAVTIPVVLTGGITKRKEAELLLKEGKADMIGVGRAISQNPDWAGLAMEERYEA